MNFEVRTIYKSDHELETRLYINGVDATDHIEKFMLSKDSTSPLKLSLTILKNIDASVDRLEKVNFKETDTTHCECQYSLTEKQPPKPKQKRLSRRLKGIIERCF